MLESGSNAQAAVMLAVRLLPELFEAVRPGDVLQADVQQVMAAAKATHFALQEVALPAFRILSAGEPVEREKSVFDSYDEENGYLEEPDISPWEICLENIETVTQAAIKLLGMSYSAVMEEELAPLLEHLKWEIEHRKEEG